VDDLRQARLYARLRRSPSPSTVPGSLPVLFFGDLFGAEIASVGLNPSDREYLNKDGVQLTGLDRRFATIDSLRADNRASLSDEQCAEAIQRMRDYFRPGKPVYKWFTALDRVTSGFGASFSAATCAHLDLVQESTRPTWTLLAKSQPQEHEELLKQDLPFLEWQIRSFSLRALICNGRTVGDQLRQKLGVSVTENGKIALIEWWVGHADFDGRRVGFAGWNKPLARATGLGREGERELGKLLAQKLGF
jgi:hypothetical protein